MRSPLWVETVLGLIPRSERSLLLFFGFLVGSGPSRSGQPFWVEFALWAYALDRNEGLSCTSVL